MTQETGRSALKARRREQLLASAAELFAAHGFRAVRLEDIGAGAGISGPAVYRHFRSKEAVLTELLVGISEHLAGGGAAVAEDADAPDEAMRALVSFHLTFALERPELIRIQDRDFAALPEDAQQQVRRLQRRYIRLWAEMLRQHHPGLDPVEATVRVQGVFGLLNSTSHLDRRLPRLIVSQQLREAALGALGVA